MSARQIQDLAKGPTSPKSPLGQSYSLPDDDYGDAITARGSSAIPQAIQASADASIATAIPGLNAVPTPAIASKAQAQPGSRNSTSTTATQSPTARAATLRGASLSPVLAAQRNSTIPPIGEGTTLGSAAVTSASAAGPGAASASASKINRSSSLRNASPRPQGMAPLSNSPDATPPQYPSRRHMSHSSHSRPAAQPSEAERRLWESNVAASNLAQSSDGLQALLRDHPELVSDSLAAAAGGKWSGAPSRGGASAFASRSGSGQTTPAEEWEEDHQIQRHSSFTANPNLGSAGELVQLPACFRHPPEGSVLTLVKNNTPRCEAGLFGSEDCRRNGRAACKGKELS